MDGRRFDDLTRLFGHGTTRRRVVAAALGLAALAVDRGDASARQSKCRRYRQTCTRDGQCCSGICGRGGLVPLKDRNRCTCPAGLTGCGIDCVNIATDEANCGGCGIVCDSLEICVSGTCVCDSGLTACDGVCIDTDTDENNCGACGETCDTVNGEICEAGTCALSCADVLEACTIDSDCCNPVDRRCYQGVCKIRNGRSCDNNTGDGRDAPECVDGYCDANGTCGE